MKITNSQEANQYYKIVNDLVDQYIKKWKIKPSSLNQYLKPGSVKFESFIQKNGLGDVEGIKRIVQDVIEDRQHMELDGIMTFESFKSINESIFEVGKSTMEHEKVLADYFNTSVGHVEVKDAEKHLYEVNDFGDKHTCYIYSNSELNEIKEKLVSESYKVACSKSIIIDNYPPYIHIKLENLISEDKFKEVYKKSLTEEMLLQVIENKLSVRIHEEFKGYQIWEV